MKPPSDMYKMNVDAARDSFGLFVMAKHGCISGPLNPTLAEASSVREALSWIKQAGLSHIQVELDSQMGALCSSSVNKQYSTCPCKGCLFFV
ncbi:conserved hypothetical protein [Ricinus communis]|uniref:RNase H type-1 domain-containing protein n=1 Tax=Ricinus communis TaxID=3988 RepID=B9SDP8_RICCO|nr:conserved hypothetical protein [Ricinus communis]